MTDFNAFSEWLWSCDPGLAVRVQDWHAQWRAMLAHHNRYKLKKQTAFTIDGRYRVVSRYVHPVQQPAAHTFPYNCRPPPFRQSQAVIASSRRRLPLRQGRVQQSLSY